MGFGMGKPIPYSNTACAVRDSVHRGFYAGLVLRIQYRIPARSPPPGGGLFGLRRGAHCECDPTDGATVGSHLASTEAWRPRVWRMVLPPLSSG